MKGKPTEWDAHFATYVNTVGSEYEFIGSVPTRYRDETFFLYDDSENWGGAPDNVLHSLDYDYNKPRLTAGIADLTAMQKQQRPAYNYSFGSISRVHD